MLLHEGRVLTGWAWRRVGGWTRRVALVQRPRGEILMEESSLFLLLFFLVFVFLSFVVSFYCVIVLFVAVCQATCTGHCSGIPLRPSGRWRL